MAGQGYKPITNFEEPFDESHFIDNYKKKRTPFYRWLIALFIVVAIVSLGAGYYVIRHKNKQQPTTVPASTTAGPETDAIDNFLGDYKNWFDDDFDDDEEEEDDTDVTNDDDIAGWLKSQYEKPKDDVGDKDFSDFAWDDELKDFDENELGEDREQGSEEEITIIEEEETEKQSTLIPEVESVGNIGNEQPQYKPIEIEEPSISEEVNPPEHMIVVHAPTWMDNTPQPQEPLNVDPPPVNYADPQNTLRQDEAMQEGYSQPMDTNMAQDTKLMSVESKQQAKNASNPFTNQPAAHVQESIPQRESVNAQESIQNSQPASVPEFNSNLAVTQIQDSSPQSSSPGVNIPALESIPNPAAWNSKPDPAAANSQESIAIPVSPYIPESIAQARPADVNTFESNSSPKASNTQESIPDPAATNIQESILNPVVNGNIPESIAQLNPESVNTLQSIPNSPLMNTQDVIPDLKPEVNQEPFPQPNQADVNTFEPISSSIPQNKQDSVPNPPEMDTQEFPLQPGPPASANRAEAIPNRSVVNTQDFIPAPAAVNTEESIPKPDTPAIDTSIKESILQPNAATSNTIPEPTDVETLQQIDNSAGVAPKMSENEETADQATVPESLNETADKLSQSEPSSQNNVIVDDGAPISESETEAV